VAEANRRAIRRGSLGGGPALSFLVSEKAAYPFLGRQSPFPTSFLRIARLSGCAIVPMVCACNARRLLIRFDEPFHLEPRDETGEFLAANLPRLVRIMESQVLKYPDQWELWTRS
jgi:lauroyl/myristoyl acyltransferase